MPVKDCHHNLASPTRQITIMLPQFLLYYRIAKRTLEMFPRRKKAIRLLHLDNQPVEGSDDFILLKYKFSNAIYFSISGHTLTEQQVVMPTPAQGKSIPFTVHGFFKQNDYLLSLKGDEAVLTRVVQKKRAHDAVRTPQPYYSINMAQ